MNSILQMAQSRRRRRQRGYTLLELTVVLSIIAILLALVLYYFMGASLGSKTTQAINQLTVVQQSIHSLYNSSPDYSTLTADTISSQLPKRMVADSGGTVSLRNAYNGEVDVGPASTNGSAANNGFFVTFTGIPSEACVSLAVLDLGTSLASVEVDGGATVTDTKALAPDDAKSACGTANNSSITWTFF